MGQIDLSPEEISHETRELAWELEQTHPDRQRIKMFLEQNADLRTAMRLARIQESDLSRKPAFKPLQLHRYLQDEAPVS